MAPASIDIHDPAAPALLATWPAPAATMARAAAASGDRLLLGHELG